VLVSRRRIATEELPAIRGARQHEQRPPRLALLDPTGDVAREFPLQQEVVVGRTIGDLRFDDDTALSAEHAVLTRRDHDVRVRDLGSQTGSWHFVGEPSVLADGDVLLLGSQLIRFRLLTDTAPPPVADVPRVALGSRTPSVDHAVLEQLRADGSVRDVLHLSRGRTVLIGREHGDWVFPYDPTMSARHAEVHSSGSANAFVVRDLGSRNGVALAVRGERQVRGGERLLLGAQMLRVELE
jgi:pSer/pThr/pTyr-binding forkhead associated (FHA) protein